MPLQLLKSRPPLAASAASKCRRSRLPAEVEEGSGGGADGRSRGGEFPGGDDDRGRGGEQRPKGEVAQEPGALVALGAEGTRESWRNEEWEKRCSGGSGVCPRACVPS